MSDGPGHVIYERVEEEEDEEDDDHNDGVAGLMTHVVTNNRSPMATIDIIEDVNPFGMDNARHITAFSAFALMVGSQIGTGIFSSPSQVDQHVASPGTAMMVWVLAGLISWAGAASFAELGASIPRNGGMQEYLKYIYGGPLAFILSWTWIVAVKPSAMAIQSLLFAEYWTNAIFSASHRSVPVDKILAVLSLGVVLLVNSINVETTTRLTNVLVFPKLGTVTLIILLALIAAITGLNSDGEGPSNDWKTKSWFATRQTESGDVQVDWSMLTSWELMGNYVAAFYAGLWAYGGWDQANWVAGEMKNTSRDLPKAIHIATPTVICCFLLANISYYVILPWSTLGNSDTIAVVAGKKIVGPVGGLLFATLVSVSCIGALNVNVFTTGRLTVAAARQGYLPKVLGEYGHDNVGVVYQSDSSTVPKRMKSFFTNTFRKIGSFKTPVAAMTCNAIITCFYIYLGSFGSLVTFIGIAEYAFYFLTVFGSLLLRRREPSLKRPYQPITFIPIVFCVASLLLVLRGIVYAPLQGLTIAGMIAVGILLHFGRWRSTYRTTSTS